MQELCQHNWEMSRNYKHKRQNLMVREIPEVTELSFLAASFLNTLKDQQKLFEFSLLFTFRSRINVSIN